MDDGPDRSIRGFFRGKCVVMTGATGFVGKVLLETLLRTCPEVDCVYVIVREKKGQPPEERTARLLQSSLFSVVRERHPLAASKVHTLAGDLTKENLGLSNEDGWTLRDRCHVIFHCAASVAFNDPLKQCVEQNVVPVRVFLRLAQSFKALKAFVHVSTAYANCNKDVIEERVYPPPKIRPSELVQALDWLPIEAVDAMTPTVLEDWPNTYTYTKHMAEHFVEVEGAQRGLPCAIVRPSIVTPVAFAPLPGWTDTHNGATGFFNSVGMGILRVLYWPANARLDLVPVDVVANTCIAVAWETASFHGNEHDGSPRVYNCTAAQAPPLLGYDCADLLQDAWKEIGPPSDAIRAPRLAVYITKSAYYYLHLFLAHTMYALGIDALLRLAGQRPMFLRMYHNVDTMIRTYMYFMNGSWHWADDNVQALKQRMTESERSVWRVDVQGIDWRQYLIDYCNGIKKYMCSGGRMRRAAPEKSKKRHWGWLVCLVVLALSLAIIPVASH